MKKLLSSIACVAVLSGCAAPTTYTSAPFIQYDKDTEYAVEDRPNGFDISVNYSRYQFIPESASVATACKQALTSIAHEEADKRKRKIETINEQRIKISMGRNGFAGTTTCAANVQVLWQTKS